MDPRAITAIVEYGAQQKAQELSDLIEFLERHGPIDTALEIGSWSGGTLWVWSQLAKRVISIDINPVRSDHLPCESVLVQGDSHNEMTKARLEGFTPVDLLYIDGDHTYEGAARDWELYSPLVRPGGFVVLHDIVTHDPGVDCHVDRLWREIQEHHRTVEIIRPEDTPIEPGHPAPLPRNAAGLGVVRL